MYFVTHGLANSGTSFNPAPGIPLDFHASVKSMIRMAIEAFTSRGLEIGICGQAPSDHPSEFPPFLVDCGITSISVTPDTAMAVRQSILESEMMIAQGIKIEE